MKVRPVVLQLIPGNSSLGHRSGLPLVANNINFSWLFKRKEPCFWRGSVVLGAVRRLVQKHRARRNSLQSPRLFARAGNVLEVEFE